MKPVRLLLLVAASLAPAFGWFVGTATATTTVGARPSYAYDGAVARRCDAPRHRGLGDRLAAGVAASCTSGSRGRPTRPLEDAILTAVRRALNPSAMRTPAGAATGRPILSAVVAPKAADLVDDVHPSTPTGQKGSPADVPKGTNSPTEIGGRSYGGHALDQMQGRGIPPSAVEDAIANGQAASQTGGRIAHYSPENNITVITENGKVVTATYGKVSPR